MISQSRPFSRNIQLILVAYANQFNGENELENGPEPSVCLTWPVDKWINIVQCKRHLNAYKHQQEREREKK